jgi:hypothetical protein
MNVAVAQAFEELVLKVSRFFRTKVLGWVHCLEARAALSRRRPGSQRHNVGLHLQLPLHHVGLESGQWGFLITATCECLPLPQKKIILAMLLYDSYLLLFFSSSSSLLLVLVLLLLS